MTTVHFSAYSCKASDLVNGSAEQFEKFLRVNNIGSSGKLAEGQAYTMDLDSAIAPSIVATLNRQPQQARVWTMQAAANDGEELHREAAFWDQYLAPSKISTPLGLVGSSADLVTNARIEQLSGFHKALVRYENALLDVQNPSHPSMPGAGARAAQARTRAIQAYNTLVNEHQRAMRNLAPAVLRTKNRGTAINSAERGITLATRSQGRQPDPRLIVTDHIQANRLLGYARYFTRSVPYMALAADGLDRSGKVLTARNGGGDFGYEVFKHTGGFAAAAGSGYLGGKLTYAAMGGSAKTSLLIAMGPKGWFVLGCIVVVVAGVSYASGKGGAAAGEFGGGLLHRAWKSITSWF